jgi:hypothetical protein
MAWRRVVECVGLIDGFWQGWPSDLPIAMTGAGREGSSFRNLFWGMVSLGHACHLHRFEKSLWEFLPSLPEGPAVNQGYVSVK